MQPGIGTIAPGGAQGMPGAPNAPGAMSVPSGPPPKDIPIHSGVSTPQPVDARVRFVTGAAKKLSENDWTALSNDLYMGVNASLTACGPYFANLKDWSDAYDMIVGEKDFPFEDSSNITVPYIQAQLESMVAYVGGTVLTPRLYIVTGNTESGARVAPRVEKFYNADLVRLRNDGSSYFSRYIDWLHMSLRDGTGILECLWNRRRQRRRASSWVPKQTPSGALVLDDQGNPVWDERVETTDVYVKDFAEYTIVKRKEFLLMPAESMSIEEAVAVAKVEWPYEEHLDRMVRAGFMDSGEVERALNYVMTGTTEVASDRTGYYDKNASQQIGIGQGQGTMASRFFKNRGPIKVWRIHSRQFDMNGDGIPEENIFWLHEQSQRMLGWMPYDYATGLRPFFSFCPFPRPDGFDGYSLIERLAGCQSEIDTSHNQRNDQISYRISPPMFVQQGSMVLDQQGTWRPGKKIEVEDTEKTLRIPTLPDIPVASWQEEALLKSYGSDYTGLSNPAMGTQSSGRRSATEIRGQNQGQGTRVGLISTRLRLSIGQVINFTHALNKQYQRTDQSTTVDSQIYTLPLEDLAQDLTIGVAGATDPIDSTTRRNEALSLYELLSKDPQIAQSPVRMWYLRQALLDAFNRPDAQQLNGTEQEAQQAEMQAKQMQALQMQQMQAQGGAQQSPGQGAPQQPQPTG
jgi:hypothetical protein